MKINLNETLASIREISQVFPWESKDAYASYLAQTYYYVAHSTQFLALSAGTMKTADLPFHRRFLEHASEEKGHETMLLNDLKNLGYKIEDFPELPETRMFWEPQFYKIQHVDPLSVMGYIVALEALATELCPKLKIILEANHPAGSFSFIKVHGEDDPDHVEKALAVIYSLPPERQKHIQENFVQSVLAYQAMVLKIKESISVRELLKVG